jgi:hypothetical protein
MSSHEKETDVNYMVLSKKPSATERLVVALDELLAAEASHRRYNSLDTLLRVAGAKHAVLMLTEQSRQERRLG